MSAQMATVCRMNVPDDGHEFVASADDDPSSISATVDITPGLFFAACIVCTALLARSQYKTWRNSQDADRLAQPLTQQPTSCSRGRAVFCWRERADYPVRHIHCMSWMLSLLTGVGGTRNRMSLLGGRRVSRTEGRKPEGSRKWAAAPADSLRCCVVVQHGAPAARAALKGKHRCHRGGARH
jgi:hypothetical protein